MDFNLPDQLFQRFEDGTIIKTLKPGDFIRIYSILGVVLGTGTERQVILLQELNTQRKEIVQYRIEELKSIGRKVENLRKVKRK